MRRREFVGLVGSFAVARPLVARAQQSPIPVIGYLSSIGRNDRPELPTAFRQGLSESGFIEGCHVAIEYRFAENSSDRLPALAADLANSSVAAIAATSGGNSIFAAKAATSAIPVVFVTAGDPVQQGYVASLNRPGGNVTGVNWFGTQLAAKGLGMLHELVPKAQTIALLSNPVLPEFLSAPTGMPRMQPGRSAFSSPSFLLAPSGIDEAFAALRQRRVTALLVGGDPFFTSRRQQIVALAARDGIPAMYPNREYVIDGGLMSYGNDISDAYRRAGGYVGRILRGEKPADLPVQQATQFQFLINLKTAKALGIEVPITLLGRADELVE